MGGSKTSVVCTYVGLCNDNQWRRSMLSDIAYELKSEYIVTHTYDGERPR